MFRTLLLVSRPAAPLAIGWVLRQVSVPTLRQLPALHLVQVIGQLGIFLAILPRRARPTWSATPRPAGRNFCCEMLPYFVRYEETLVLRPAVEPLGTLDLFDAQRLAVSGMVALLGGRTVRDHALDDDHGWPVLLGLEGLERGRQSVDVIGVVDPLDRPAVTLETLADVLGESQIGAGPR